MSRINQWKYPGGRPVALLLLAEVTDDQDGPTAPVYVTTDDKQNMLTKTSFENKFLNKSMYNKLDGKQNAFDNASRNIVAGNSNVFNPGANGNQVTGSSN